VERARGSRERRDRSWAAAGVSRQCGTRGRDRGGPPPDVSRVAEAAVGRHGDAMPETAGCGRRPREGPPARVLWRRFRFSRPAVGRHGRAIRRGRDDGLRDSARRGWRASPKRPVRSDDDVSARELRGDAGCGVRARRAAVGRRELRRSREAGRRWGDTGCRFARIGWRWQATPRKARGVRTTAFHVERGRGAIRAAVGAWRGSGWLENITGLDVVPGLRLQSVGRFGLPDRHRPGSARRRRRGPVGGPFRAPSPPWPGRWAFPPDES
jgi:hypothetical protein